MNLQGSTVRPEELEAWREYIGRCEIRREILDMGVLRRFAAAVGSTLDVEREAPPLAHWAFFADVAPTDRLSRDGHPDRGGGIYPPIGLPSRVFAGSSIEFHEPLAWGEEAERTLTLIDVRHRVGKSGSIVFIDVEHRLRQAQRDRVVERQSIAYRERISPMSPIRCSPREALREERLWTPRAADLFRFSAVTFNAHRIHYDERYATGVEGYPDLVVHGPLTAVKLFGFAQARLRRPILHFRFRAAALLFVDQPAILVAAAAPHSVQCLRCDGEVAMTATASEGRT